MLENPIVPDGGGETNKLGLGGDELSTIIVLVPGGQQFIEQGCHVTFNRPRDVARAAGGLRGLRRIGSRVSL